jgi:hypothetical protein
MAGELTGVKSKLENLEDTYDNDEFNAVIRRLEGVIDGNDLEDEYAMADFTDDAQSALEDAAASGDLDEKYANIFRNAGSLRDALAETASRAFDSSAKQFLEDAADESELNAIYSLCAQGRFEEAADRAGIGDASFEHVADCKHQGALEIGYARTLFDAYKDDDSSEAYVPPSTPEAPN